MMLSRAWPAVVLGSVLSLSGLAGCKDDGAGVPEPDLAQAPPDLAPPPPDMMLPDRDPTDHPPGLQLQHFGGPTLAAIEPYTVVWHGEDVLGQKMHKFISWLVKSDFWVHTTTEYGGGVGTPKDLIVLDEAPPATLDDDQMEGIVSALVTSGKIPEVNDNTIVMFVFSTATKSTMFGGRGCQDYGGYHSETQGLVAGRHVPYAVNLQCAGEAASSQTAFDSLTFVISHEAVEAQTDPHPFYAPGWITDQSAIGGEVSDLCVYAETTAVAPGENGEPDITYVLNPVYSNAAVKAGNKEPCQPTAPDDIYFSVAVSPYEIQVTPDDSGVGDAEAEYQPFAFGDVGKIKWTVIQPPGQGIKVNPSSGEASAGDTLRLKVHTTSAARRGSYPLVLGVRNDKGGRTQAATVITVN